MGRAVIKELKESTLLTFFEFCAMHGLRSETDYFYRAQSGIIKFSNGSSIYLKDLKLDPADPEFDSLGSTEYCGGFIDEGSQVVSKAKTVLQSRFRYKLEEFKIVPKLLIGSNPCKTFLYTDFYKLWKQKALPGYRRFITSLVDDNPYMSPQYKLNLQKMDEKSKQRLLFGNWEYDSDPSRIFNYDKILDSFTNTFIKGDGQKKYIICDPARGGRDRTVVGLWEGFHLKKVWAFRGQMLDETETFLLQIAEAEGVPRSHMLGDEDGLGGGIIDHLHIKGFVNGSKPMNMKKDENYSNLKTQCYFKAAELINSGLVYLEVDNPEYKELIINDLEQIRRRDIDKDNKVTIEDKKTIKERTGRSPDFGDMIMMRMFFEVGVQEEFHNAQTLDVAF